MSECIWPRNEEGKMSFKPIMDTFIDKCKIDIDWKVCSLLFSQVIGFGLMSSSV